MVGGCQLQDAKPAPDRRTRRAEDHVEAVALGLDLRPIELAHRLPHHAAVLAEQKGGGVVTVALDPCRVAAEVGEEKAAGDTGRPLLGQDPLPSSKCAQV
jgi:hypothetical protein